MNTIEIEKLKLLFNSKAIKQQNNRCWGWEGYKSNGYGRIQINNKRIGSHVASYLIHKGEIPKSLFVLHSCDNKECSNPTHLFLGTQKDNVIDMLKKNRSSNQKITPEVINAILYAYPNTSASIVAKLYNINRKTIYSIRNGKSWKFRDINNEKK